MRTANCRRVKLFEFPDMHRPNLKAKLSSLRESFAFRQGVTKGLVENTGDFFDVIAHRVKVIFITPNAVGENSDKQN